MDIASALAILDKTITLIGAIGSLTEHAQQISSLIKQAQAEGRTTFTPDEWKTVTGIEDTARAALIDAIAAHGGTQP